jgi:hypothetical protein
MIERPLGFVLVPFATKKDPSGGPDTDFERLYEEAILLGLEAADMEPSRAEDWFV